MPFMKASYPKDSGDGHIGKVCKHEDPSSDPSTYIKLSMVLRVMKKVKRGTSRRLADHLSPAKRLTPETYVGAAS